MATQTTRKLARGKSASPAASTSEFDFTRSPIHLLRRAQQRALEIFNHEVGASGLTPRQFVVLLAVQENEGLTQTDLVNRTRIDRSTLADMISRLIKREMLGRRRTERDQRANAVTITATGRKALKTALARIARAEDKLLETVPENRRGVFLDSLGVIAQVAETTPKPAAAKRAAPAAKARTKTTASKTRVAKTPAAKTSKTRTPAAKPAARRAPAARGRATAAAATPAAAATKAASTRKAPAARSRAAVAAKTPKPAAKPKKAPAARTARKAKARK